MTAPSEDQPDLVDVGPVLCIPIRFDDDPRLGGERQAWSLATQEAQALHSADELLAGLEHRDWRVRHEVVDRLLARAKNDPRTLPSLMHVARTDGVWQVRDAAVLRLSEFEPDVVLPTLREASSDAQPEVRWAASHSRAQLGKGEPPHAM